MTARFAPSLTTRAPRSAIAASAPDPASSRHRTCETADNSREKLIFTKEQLLAPLQEGMAAPPHAMAPHMEERDYFLGKVHSASPEQHAEADQLTEGGAH